MSGPSSIRSLRSALLWGILLPVTLLVGINTVSLYSEALGAINTAYDRTLLASSKSIGEQLDVSGYDAQAVIRAVVPYAALVRLQEEAVQLIVSILNADCNYEYSVESSRGITDQITK